MSSGASHPPTQKCKIADDEPIFRIFAARQIEGDWFQCEQHNNKLIVDTGENNAQRSFRTNCQRKRFLVTGVKHEGLEHEHGP